MTSLMDTPLESRVGGERARHTGASKVKGICKVLFEKTVGNQLWSASLRCNEKTYYRLNSIYVVVRLGNYG